MIWTSSNKCTVGEPALKKKKKSDVDSGLMFTEISGCEYKHRKLT